MKISRSSLVLTAAMTGLLGGTIARAATPTQDSSSQSSKPAKNKVEKHACAGKNSCKGNGGCATDGSKSNKAAAAGITEKHSCAGKNSCKGLGGCATDGKKH
ncbi:MAG: hypothetical protein WBY44_02110 [Bryobacteraceae bacterium]|jgi:hypothetical protein